MKKAKIIMTLSIAIMVTVIIAGTPSLVGASRDGYTKQDSLFFAWTDDTLLEIMEASERIDDCGYESGHVMAYWYSNLETLAREKLTELGRYRVSNNAQSVKDAFRSSLQNIAAFGDYAGRGTSTGDEDLMGLADRQLKSLEGNLREYLDTRNRILNEGLVEGENTRGKQCFLVTPCEAISISVNSEEIQNFLRSTDHPVHLEIVFSPDRGVYGDDIGRMTWMVIWSAGDKAISTEVDVEAGNLPGGSSTGYIVEVVEGIS